jgi:hypothetical protein
MSIMNLWKQPVLWVAGLALALAAGNVFAEPPGRCARAGVSEPYFVYGKTFTRRGEQWVYLGTYDGFSAAKLVARSSLAPEGGGYPDTQTIPGSRLTLPEAKEDVVYRLFRLTGKDGKKEFKEEGQFRTAQEAAAAAEKIVADGDRFEVLYDQFSK